MQPLLTFLTTIAGAFIGVYLKEFFADTYFGKRRKRELKFTIVKNVVKYFTLSKKFADVYNNNKLHQHRLKLLADFRNNFDEPSRLKISIIDEKIERLFTYGKELDTKSHEMYLMLMDFQAEIMAALVESEKYLPKHVYRQLDSTISKMFSEEQNNRIHVTGIIQQDYDELMSYQQNQYSKDLYAVVKQLGKDQSTFLQQIREIFTI